MIVVFQFFRAGLAVATHPGEALQALREAGDATAQRRAEMNEVVQFALQTLKDNSPKGSGKDPHPGLYRDNHTLFVNGNDVSDLSSWNPGDAIEISNPEPYARILELGDGKLRVPHHTYELTEQALQSKYGDIARIELAYLPVRIAVSASSKTGRRIHTRSIHESGWLAQQPTITIKGLS
jgi:hypothetical protein